MEDINKIQIGFASEKDTFSQYLVKRVSDLKEYELLLSKILINLDAIKRLRLTEIKNLDYEKSVLETQVLNLNSTHKTLVDSFNGIKDSLSSESKLAEEKKKVISQILQEFSNKLEDFRESSKKEFLKTKAEIEALSDKKNLIEKEVKSFEDKKNSLISLMSSLTLDIKSKREELLFVEVDIQKKKNESESSLMQISGLINESKKRLDALEKESLEKKKYWEDTFEEYIKKDTRMHSVIESLADEY